MPFVNFYLPLPLSKHRGVTKCTVAMSFFGHYTNSAVHLNYRKVFNSLITEATLDVIAVLFLYLSLKKNPSILPFFSPGKKAAVMNGGWLLCRVITRSSKYNFPLVILEALHETMYAIPAIKCIDFPLNTLVAVSVPFSRAVRFYLPQVSKVRLQTTLLWIT